MSTPALEPPAVVVWLGDRTRDGATRAVEEWARARGVRLTSVEGTDAPPGAAAPLAVEIVEQVERELARAADALTAVDTDGAERALARAEQLVRAHAELPQAPWLLAEVLRGWANRYARLEPRDEARARSAWQAAHAIDGGRVAGVGETQTAAPPDQPLTLSLAGATAATELRLDGAPLPPRTRAGATLTFETRAAAGTHHVAVTRRGITLLSTWVTVAAPSPLPTSPTRIDLDVGDGGACSEAAFEGARVEGDRVAPPPSATCPRWIAVVPRERPGVVSVAECAGAICGPLVEWRASTPSSRFVPVAPPPGGGFHWPAWATWTLLGVGAVAATATAVFASGALDERPVEQRFVAGGARVE